MDPATLAALVQIAANLGDMAIRQAEARQAQAVLEASDRLAAIHVQIVAIDFNPGQEKPT